MKRQTWLSQQGCGDTCADSSGRPAERHYPVIRRASSGKDSEITVAKSLWSRNSKGLESRGLQPRLVSSDCSAVKMSFLPLRGQRSPKRRLLGVNVPLSEESKHVWCYDQPLDQNCGLATTTNLSVSMGYTNVAGIEWEWNCKSPQEQSLHWMHLSSL